MESRDSVREPKLERQGRRLAHPALRFLALALVVAVPGAVLVAVDNSWSLPFGIALLLLASVPAAFAVGLLVSASVARWAARHRLFA